MSNILLLKSITKHFDVYLPDDIILYISKLSRTPICRTGVRLAIQYFKYVLEDIININNIYTYDMNTYGVNLQDEYKYSKTISKYCRRVNPLNRSQYNSDDLYIEYDMHGFGGHYIYDYVYHDRYNDDDNLSDFEKHQLVSINWCGIDIINHFRKIDPIHYMSYQIPGIDLINSDNRILTESNKDDIPCVLALRPANLDDFNSRVANVVLYDSQYIYNCMDSIHHLYETMLHVDKKYVNNFWKSAATNYSKLLWRPLSDVDNGGEVPTIELID